MGKKMNRPNSLVSFVLVAGLSFSAIPAFLSGWCFADEHEGIKARKEPLLPVSSIGQPRNVDKDDLVKKLNVVASRLGETGPAGDVNDDHIVDILDLVTEVQRWTDKPDNVIAETPKDKPSLKASKFIPPDDKVLLIIGHDQESADQYIKATGMIPGGFMFYTSIQNMDGLDHPANPGGGIQDAKYLMDQYPNTVIQIGLEMVNGLEETISGLYDTNIDKLSDWIKQSKRPVYLRIGYEFDGRHNHYDPEQYVKAYQHIVDRMRQNGVENIVFVWHSNAVESTYHVTDWYPGDKYVDWFGVTYFTPSVQNPYLSSVVELAKLHNKPLMIAEATPFRLKTSDKSNAENLWKTWYQSFFNFIKQHGVKVVSYINVHWDIQPMFQGLGFGDGRIQANDLIKQNWLKEIKNPHYLQSSENLFKELNYSED